VTSRVLVQMVVTVLRASSRIRGYTGVARQPRFRECLLSSSRDEPFPVTTEEEQIWRASFAPMVVLRGPTPKRCTTTVNAASVSQSGQVALAKTNTVMPFAPGPPSRPRSSLGSRARPRPPSAGSQRLVRAPVRRDIDRCASLGPAEQVTPGGASLKQLPLDALPPTPSSRVGTAISLGSARRCLGSRPSTVPAQGAATAALPSVLQVSNAASFVANSATDRCCDPRVRSTSEFALYIQTMKSGGGRSSGSAAAPVSIRGGGSWRPTQSSMAPAVAVNSTSAAAAAHSLDCGGEGLSEHKASVEDRSHSAIDEGQKSPQWEWCPSASLLASTVTSPTRQPSARSPSPPLDRPRASWRCGLGCGPEGWSSRNAQAEAEGKTEMRLDAEVRARRRERGKARKEKHLVLPFTFVADDPRCTHLASMEASPPVAMVFNPA